jgi:hypothetical protein
VIPEALARGSWWRRLWLRLTRRPVTIFCPRCGRPRTGQRHVRARQLCDGFYDFDPMNGRPKIPLCFGVQLRSG